MDSEKVRTKRRNQIRDEIITSKQALNILGFSRVRLHQIVGEGRIEPIISGIYLKDDILAFQQEREEAGE